MVDPVRAEARSLFLSALHDSDRVLVTGAGGWFGSTVAALLHGSGHPAAFTTQRPRVVSHGWGVVEAIGWNWNAVQDFAPTVVFDCAFVLRDYVNSMPIEQYVHANTVVTARLLQLAHLPSVRAVISVSSGAAVHPQDAGVRGVEADPYGYLKRQAELALLAVGETVAARVVVARSWSLSGALVTRPERYAFSNLVMQARSGVIRVEAAHEVWRRYVGVDDFFAVALAKAAGSSGVLDSGGELIEFGGLAQRICDALSVTVEIRRPAPSGQVADEYYSRSDAWDAACSDVGLAPASLDDQVVDVDAYLRGLVR